MMLVSFNIAFDDLYILLSTYLDDVFCSLDTSC